MLSVIINFIKINFNTFKQIIFQIKPKLSYRKHFRLYTHWLNLIQLKWDFFLFQLSLFSVEKRENLCQGLFSAREEKGKKSFDDQVFAKKNLKERI